jgi:hypothetical protein
MKGWVMASKLRTKKKARIEQDVLTILLQLITATFPDDKLAPGVVTSFLPSNAPLHPKPSAFGKCWYASITRVPTSGERLVVAVAYGDSIADVHKALAETFLKRTQIAATLRRALRRG